jgi:beta-phosphoglucomutase-like phosphatase (HAD superfamily)
MVQLGLADRRAADADVIEQLRKVLGNAEAVLFDFDGPVCSVFAGYPAPQVATDLRAHLEQIRPDVVWSAAGRSDDPMRVLIDAPGWGPEFAVTADDQLAALETLAVVTAAPAIGGEASMRACLESGRRLAIVSNNSARAVQTYLDQHGLADLAGSHVIGRRHGRPELMKPHPAPITDAVRALGVDPSAAVLVGDSLTDVVDARAAGIMCIGFADKPGKSELLADADVVIDDMRELAEHLRDVARPR